MWLCGIKNITAVKYPYPSSNYYYYLLMKISFTYLYSMKNRRYQINTGFYLPGTGAAARRKRTQTDVSGRRQFSPCVAFLASTSPTPMILAGLVDPSDDTSDAPLQEEAKSNNIEIIGLSSHICNTHSNYFSQIPQKRKV